MSVVFDKNAYLNAVKEKYSFNTNNDILAHTEQKGLRFKYFDINAQEFNRKYSAKNWVGRKVIALPLAIWCGVIKTIYHITKAIFVGVILYGGKGGRLKVQCFYIVRNLQKSFACLATLLNDRYGQYHFQLSKFHENCYTNFLNSKQPYKLSIGSGNNFIPPASDSNTAVGDQSVISEMMNDPSGFARLSDAQKAGEDIVVAALNGCKSAAQAEGVLQCAHYLMSSNKKVAFALIKVDPVLFENLSFNIKGDLDVVKAALNSCKTTEQAEKVIKAADCNAQQSKIIALMLIEIDLKLLEHFWSDVKNDLDVVYRVIELSKTEQTLYDIWKSYRFDIKNNKSIKAKVEEKYPGFFQKYCEPQKREDIDTTRFHNARWMELQKTIDSCK